jgi:chemotaxis protein CheD
VIVQRLPHAHDAEVMAAERAIAQKLAVAPVAGDIELFG